MTEKNKNGIKLTIKEQSALRELLLPPPVYCANPLCRCLINIRCLNKNSKVKVIKTKAGMYCDKWCWESVNPPPIIECKYCSNVIGASKSGRVTYYKQFCNKDCYKNYKLK